MHMMKIGVITGICNNTPCDSSIHGFDWWYSSFDSFERDNKNHTLDIRYVSGSENFPWVVGVYNMRSGY